ncbi:MAG: transcription termination factor NusA [Ignavibacteria bacterium]|nr:transcription termination factor NusA [Ignavibacteria bacterium]
MNSEIVDSFSQMVREKGIDKDVLAGVVEDVFSMMVRKRFGQEAKFEVVVNMDKGDIEIFLEREVVETVEDPNLQIDLKTARDLSGEDLEIGEDYVEVVPLVTFGRRLVVSAKQNLNQRIKEIERDIIFNEYSNAIGDIIVGEIYQIRRNEILINHNRNELVLPKSEQIPKERYKKGETIRAVVKEVRKNSGTPAVIVSRADMRFLAKLFELEIPEIYDGIIEIKAIAREPGERAKVAVESHDDRIDAVGACVGMKGVRIHTIVRELNNENIDVINFTDQPELFIQRALSPAKIVELKLSPEEKSCEVLVANDQVSLAIGRNGQNIRLASRLTGYELNLIKEGGDEDEYDIELIDFKDDLGEELYLKLIAAGFDTAKEVINAPMEKLAEVEGLDEARVHEIWEMMQRDLEEAEVGEGEIEIRKSDAEAETTGEDVTPEESSAEGIVPEQEEEAKADEEEPSGQKDPADDEGDSSVEEKEPVTHSEDSSVAEPENQPGNETKVSGQ